MITVYTDASAGSKLSVATSILLADGYNVGTVVRAYDTTSPPVAELYGVIQALEFIREYVKDYDKVVIYSDLESTSMFYNRIKRTGRIGKAENYHLWKKIVKLSDGMDLTIKYVKSHKCICSDGNSACDLISRIVRRSLEERLSC